MSLTLASVMLFTTSATVFANEQSVSADDILAQLNAFDFGFENEFFLVEQGRARGSNTQPYFAFDTVEEYVAFVKEIYESLNDALNNREYLEICFYEMGLLDLYNEHGDFESFMRFIPIQLNEVIQINPGRTIWSNGINTLVNISVTLFLNTPSIFHPDVGVINGSWVTGVFAGFTWNHHHGWVDFMRHPFAPNQILGQVRLNVQASIMASASISGFEVGTIWNHFFNQIATVRTW